MPSLTQKIGPLPAWAWGGLVAVAAWWFFLRKPATGTTANAAASGSQLASGYGLGFAQGQQAAQANLPPGQGPTGSGLGKLRLVTKDASPGQWPQGVPVWNQAHTGASIVAYLPYGGDVDVSGPSVNNDGFQWYPVGLPGQGTGYVASNVVAGIGGGVGGPKTSRSHAIGSRSSNYWSDAHPDIGANVRYAHYVRAVGGPASHQSEVRRVARQSGVHESRIMMLNPHHTGRIRIA